MAMILGSPRYDNGRSASRFLEIHIAVRASTAQSQQAAAGSSARHIQKNIQKSQDDRPTMAEAIRRLVELGLKANPKP
jgi:hypothetical protein